MALSIWQSYWISTGGGEAWTLAGLSGDWLVRPITTILSSYPTELAVSLAVVGLTALVFALQALFRRERGDEPAEAPPAAAPLPEGPARERSIETGLQALQAQAAQQIDAAEHALNRLLAECSGIVKLPVEPTVVPERQLKTEAPAPSRQSLAA